MKVSLFKDFWIRWSSFLHPPPPTQKKLEEWKRKIRSLGKHCLLSYSDQYSVVPVALTYVFGTCTADVQGVNKASDVTSEWNVEAYWHITTLSQPKCMRIISVFHEEHKLSKQFCVCSDFKSWKCVLFRERGGDGRRMHKPHNQYYYSTFSLFEDCLCHHCYHYHYHYHQHHHFHRQLFISKDSYLPRPHHFPLKWEMSDNVQQLIYGCSWHWSCQTIWNMHLFIEVEE